MLIFSCVHDAKQGESERYIGAYFSVLADGISSKNRPVFLSLAYLFTSLLV